MPEDIFEVFRNAADPLKAEKMAAYMRNKFPFLGIQKPIRAKLNRSFLKEKKKENQIDWAFVSECYAKAEREFHYLAIDYLLSVKKLLKAEDLSKIETLITTNSWWDSVDAIDSIVGDMVLRYPELKATILRYASSDNIWLRRTAIDFQLKYKEKTDTELLEKIIDMNLGVEGFFINKAIGWILREYSKTDKVWVKNFIGAHELSALSVREAIKYL